MFITPSSPTQPTESPAQSRALWIAAGVVLVILVVAGIAWLRQRGEGEGTLVAPLVVPAVTSTTRPVVQILAAPDFPQDSDHDGVADATEKEKGTDPQKGDTDEDGFTDFEELFSFQTDPLRPDPPRSHPSERTSQAPVVTP